MMRRRNVIRIGVFLALAVLFTVQLYRVFLLRFEYGDVYPPYSSFRADPLGTRAFYEALASLPGIEVQRNEQSIVKMDFGKNTSLLFAGVVDTPDPEKVTQAIEGFVLTGGRLILTLDAAAEERRRAWASSEENSDKIRDSPCSRTREDSPCFPGQAPSGEEGEAEETEGEEEDTEDEEEDTDPFAGRFVDITERWGFCFEERALPKPEEGAPRLIEVKKVAKTGTVPARGLARTVPVLPEALCWRSPFYLGDLAEHWDAIYSREDLPVIIERHWGNGSIVICADSYPLSNEAMRKHRAPGFLAWIVGPNSRVIVDEWHKGISKRPGMMALMRRYRLYPLLASLLVLIALFIWQNALSLVPKHDEAYERQGALEEAGKDASAGLNNLLRRTVSTGELVEVCYTQWTQDLSHDTRYSSEQRDAIRDIAGQPMELRSRADELVTRYRRICKTLKERT